MKSKEERRRRRSWLPNDVGAVQYAEACYQQYKAALEETEYWLASPQQQEDKEITLAAVFMNGSNLQHASEVLRNDKEVVMVACFQWGGALAYASLELQNDKDVVMGACSRNGWALEYASERIRNDKGFILVACSQNVDALQFVSEELQNELRAADEQISLAAGLDLMHCACNSKVVVMKACTQNGLALQYASQSLQNDHEVVLKACSQNGGALQFASKKLQNDKEIALKACTTRGDLALKHSSKQLQHDKDIVLLACSQNGRALQYASKELQNDEEVVMGACSQDGRALKFASQSLQNDKEVVLKACSQWGSALQYASNRFQREKEIVMVACSQNGWALQFASEALRGDKVVVMAAAESNPESLKFALAGLNQDKDCLIKANLWDKDYAKKDIRTQFRWKKIVLSTKFSLAAESSPHATRFTVELKKHQYIGDGNFVVYSPNAFNKGTCDPNWTNKKWPCRGTHASCRKPAHLKTGEPQEAECCWRYSFRHHLKEASCWGGFMIQVVDNRKQKDAKKKWWQPMRNNDELYENHKLGDGQSIETEMAQQVGTKIFRFFEPSTSQSYAEQVDKLVSEIDEWYKDGCSDMSDCNIFVVQ